MKRLFVYMVLSLLIATPAMSEDLFTTTNYQRPTTNLDAIIYDIYTTVTELSGVEYEQLQSDLYALSETPIDLNTATDEDLAQLYFLSPRQIDDILAYVGRHPMESLYELRLIPSLADYEIRDLLPFVTITNNQHPTTNDQLPTTKLYPREVFRYAGHELITRVDARNIEDYAGTDPMYVQTRYRFDYQRRVIFGAQLRRPAGGGAKDLQYGAYLQLRDISPHLHTLVAGNFQASFGQGLVLAPIFHSGKSAYVSSVGQTTEGLKYYSSVDGEGLHGAGVTFRLQWNKQTRLDISGLYSMKRANDSTWHHLLGANLSLRHKRLQVGLTAIENLWTDSIRPYNNAKYNRHYFRGYRQAVIGANIRYNYGWFDAFAEVATAQNYEHPTTNDQLLTTNSPHWGVGVIAGSRFYPTDGVSLIALYRYYSPYFDNALGYAFSETSRLGDENGGYLGFEITRLSRWRFTGYGDVFRFSGPKYGIPDFPSIGYDALAEIQYYRGVTGNGLRVTGRLRARKKGDSSLYSARAQFDWQRGGWSLRTTGEANLQRPKTNDQRPLTYGFTLYQDIEYNFQLSIRRQQIGRTINYPLSLRLRLQGFDAREWENRIYCYEHDVLYAHSIPAIYGLGGRAYLCLKWQIIRQLALYLRVSETVYQSKWASDHNKPNTRTDIHLLLRAKL